MTNKIKHCVLIFMFSFCCLTGVMVHAETSTDAVALEGKSDLGVALSHLSKLQGFSCKFEQVLSYAEGSTRVFSGTLSVLRPGKFRWHYSKPYEQLYVSNGHGVWLYEPDLMQAQWLEDLGEVEPIVIQLLDGRVGLDEVVVLGTESFGELFSAWHVRIGQSKNAVEVWLGVEARQLIWIESRDILANRNRLNLSDVNKNQPNEDSFEFKAPEGVDVIGAV